MSDLQVSMNFGVKKLKKKIVVTVIVLTILLIGFAALSKEKYDESIHDVKINHLIDNYAFKQFFAEDEQNRYGYDIRIHKSESKELLPYDVSDRKYYSYDVDITVTEDFKEFTKANTFNYMETLSDVLANYQVGKGTDFEGYYDELRLVYMDWSGGTPVTTSWIMNINGYPKELNGKTEDEYLIMYYDSNGQPVYENGY